MAAVASGWLAREMSLLAAEAERRYTEELETLRHRLQECETERMQTQLEMMRLESRAHDSDAQRSELEASVRDLEQENAELRSLSEAHHDDRTVEAAQLSRINELSRELIATRFELARVLGGGQRAGGSVAQGELSQLGMESLLTAATALDLSAADAILNPACLLTTKHGLSSVGADEHAAAAAAGAEKAAAPSAALDVSPTGLGGGHANSAPNRDAGRDAGRDAERDALGRSLDDALLAVCGGHGGACEGGARDELRSPPAVLTARDSPAGGRRCTTDGRGARSPALGSKRVESDGGSAGGSALADRNGRPRPRDGGR